MTQALRPGVHRGTVALVTGGGTGIGRSVALDLARCGADVVICGRRPEPLEKTVAEIESLGGHALYVPADIRDDDQVVGLVDVRWSGSAGSTPWSTTRAASSPPQPRRSPPRAGARCTASPSTRPGR
jgi:hypothetical protein